jgi:hypothetical protein
MDESSGPDSFNGTIFRVWKGNQPCRIYVTDRQVYFIRRTGRIPAGTPAPPDQLLSTHTDNYAIPVSDFIDPRIEPAGKYMSYGKNDGRWHFTRRGDAKETVVLFESAADMKHAASVLAGVLGTRARSDGDGRTASASTSELVTGVPLPPEQAEVVAAIQNLTQRLANHASAGWQKVHCEVRAASAFSPRPLEIVVADGDPPGECRPTDNPAIYQAAMALAQKLSSSLTTFPGLVIEMTRLEQGGWHNRVKLMDKR